MKNKIILFDGICGLCNASVTLLMRLDKKKIFKYSSLQGEFVKTLNVDDGLDSIILYEDGELYYKSTAILKILKNLGGLWKMTMIFYLLPTFVRDKLYDIVAKYRYRIFGKLEQCRMLSKEDEVYFID